MVAPSAAATRARASTNSIDGIVAGISGTATPSSVDGCHHLAEHARQHGHDVAVALDEPELDVEAGVLVDVTRGVVRLGAEHRPDLVDPLEHADHDLLVELLALREIRDAIEVAHREHVGAAFGRGAHELGRLDLHEALAVERAPKPAHRRRGDPEDLAPRRVTVRDHGVVEQRRERHVDEILAERDRRRVGHRRDHADRLSHVVEFELRLRDDHPFDRDHRLEPIAHDRERDRADATQRGQPSTHVHALADACSNFMLSKSVPRRFLAGPAWSSGTTPRQAQRPRGCVPTDRLQRRWTSWDRHGRRQGRSSTVGDH